MNRGPSHASPVSTAGVSAVTEAAGASAAAQVLERKAAFARQRAENLEKGALGERLVAAALAPLAMHGWFVLHDRVVAHRGNLDHLVIGPGGVFAVDSKHWSSRVQTAPHLRVGGRSADRAVDHLGELVAGVRSCLAAQGVDVPVRGLLVLTHDTNAALPAHAYGEFTAVGIDGLRGVVDGAPVVVRPGDGEVAFRHLSQAFPPYGDPSPPLEPLSEASALYRRANTYLFVEPWARGGRQRLYVNDHHGRGLGYKDIGSGAVAVTEPGAEPVVRWLLEGASAARLDLAAAARPRVPMGMTGGRVIGLVVRQWMTFHVGFHWRRGGLDRLYGSRVDSTRGLQELGYVDLATGAPHPLGEDALGQDLSPPRGYLERLGAAYAASRRRDG